MLLKGSQEADGDRENVKGVERKVPKHSHAQQVRDQILDGACRLEHVSPLPQAFTHVRALSKACESAKLSMSER